MEKENLVFRSSMDEKKIERKGKRFAARLKSSKGVICTNAPGPNIALCNVGQATGFERETIQKLATECNVCIPKLIAEKGQSYSFLVFHATEDALIFYNTFNGLAKVGGSPIYMNFVETVPDTEIVCPHENPNGLLLLHDFITVEEERQIITLFDWTEEDCSSLKNRQVKHYGYEFRYGSNDVDLNAPLFEKIPTDCDVLWERLKEHGIEVEQPDQLTVNKYSPGQGIPSHVDRHSPFGDTILSLSLGSAVLMDWKHHSGRCVPVSLPARSLLVMQGEARYDWQHGIQPRTHDPVIEQRTDPVTDKTHKVLTSDFTPRDVRISLTFRRTRQGACECGFETLCDRGKREMGDDVATKLEELHVHQVYERIACHFSSTRHKPWPRVVEFLTQVPTGSVLLDLGCGNGKNILPRNDIVQIAGERSEGLLSECSAHIRGLSGAACVRLDLIHCGLRERCADVVICIAVIHHFSSESRRKRAVSTISSLLRRGGRALITVWAKDQRKSNYLAKNKTQNTHQEVVSVGDVTLPVHENRTQFQHSDLLVPWKLRSKNDNKLSDTPESTLLRYYHVFEDGELCELCKESSPELVVEESFFEEGNWCVICRKI